jgi:hypothetical protein
MKKIFAKFKTVDPVSGVTATAVVVCQSPNWKLYLDNVASRRGK